MRFDICEGLESLGLNLDHERNSSMSPNANIAIERSPSKINRQYEVDRTCFENARESIATA
jgi:hypothetical protein